MQENLDTGTPGSGNASVGQKAGFAKEVWAKQLAAQKKSLVHTASGAKNSFGLYHSQLFFAGTALHVRLLVAYCANERGQTDRQKDIQTNRQTDRQRDKQRDRQID